MATFVCLFVYLYVRALTQKNVARFNGVARIFFWGGGHPAGATRSIFRRLREPTRFSGGGVVAEIFRDLQTRTRFSGGGGSSRNLP